MIFGANTNKFCYMKGFLYTLIISFLLILGCEKEKEENPFSKEYFYYTFDYDKIMLKLKGSELFISFPDIYTNKEEITNVLSKYTSLTDSIIQISYPYFLVLP